MQFEFAQNNFIKIYVCPFRIHFFLYFSIAKIRNAHTVNMFACQTESNKISKMADQIWCDISIAKIRKRNKEWKKERNENHSKFIQS